jgi:predicted permease
MGFDTARVATARVTLGGTAYGSDEPRAEFYRRVTEALAADPAIEQAGWTGGLPLSGAGNFLSFGIEGRPVPAADAVQDAQVYSASPGYFETLRIPLLSGRRFDARDDLRGAPVAIVSRAMAKRYWPGADPIGARLRFGPNDTWRTVVGVVGDVRMEPQDEPYPEIYLAQAQSPDRLMYLAVRGRGSAGAVVAAMRRAVEAADRTVPLSDIQTMDERAALATARPRGGVALIGGFAGLALALAAVGIYGVVAYATAQRRRELGIRLALGAEPAGLIRLIVRQAMLPVGLGVVAGLGAALGASRLLRSLLYGVSPLDIGTYVGVAAFVAGVALVASWLPARRAARVDPLAALRTE